MMKVNVSVKGRMTLVGLVLAGLLLFCKTLLSGALAASCQATCINERRNPDCETGGICCSVSLSNAQVSCDDGGCNLYCTCEAYQFRPNDFVYILKSASCLKSDDRNPPPYINEMNRSSVLDGVPWVLYEMTISPDGHIRNITILRTSKARQTTRLLEEIKTREGQYYKPSFEKFMKEGIPDRSLSKFAGKKMLSFAVADTVKCHDASVEIRLDPPPVATRPFSLIALLYYRGTRLEEIQLVHNPDNLSLQDARIWFQQALVWQTVPRRDDQTIMTVSIVIPEEIEASSYVISPCRF